MTALRVIQIFSKIMHQFLKTGPTLKCCSPLTFGLAFLTHFYFYTSEQQSVCFYFQFKLSKWQKDDTFFRDLILNSK